METTSFFAMISRMKYITRWGLMNNTKPENLSQHSLDVAVLSHALAVIHNVRFGGSIHAERVALYAVFHDSSEIITGDMPTPIKYFNNQIQDAYKQIEHKAQERLINMLPADLQPVYAPILDPQDDEQELWKFVKAGDKLSALIKCIEERRMGNTEFMKAEQSIKENLNEMDMPEIAVFLNEMLPAYSLTLDEQETGQAKE